MKYQRKCKNFVSTFLDWTLHRSAAPESYHYFAAIYTLACALRRNVVMDEEELGNWKCYPFLYVFFVGPPGTYKTTAMNNARQLLDCVETLTPAANATSPEALFNRLVDTQDNAIYIFAKEFSDLVSKQKDNSMYGFLTTMFDGDGKWEAHTISRSVQFAHEPCINMLAATTPGWISSYMPETAINGGMASRCILIYEHKPRFRKLIFKGITLPKEQLEKMHMDLVSDLTHISELKGTFSFDTPETSKFIDDWSNALEPDKMGRLAGYYNRKSKHVLSLAMLIHIAYSDELVLTTDDIKQAIAVLDTIEPQMKDAFAGIGKNPYTADTRGIYKYIQERGEVNRKSVAKEFESSATPVILHNLIDGLVMSGSIKQLVKGNDIFLSVI